MNVHYLCRELKSAENSLSNLEDKKHQDQQRKDSNYPDVVENSSYDRLLQLQNKTDSLALAQDYLLFLESASTNIDADNNNNDDIVLFAQVKLYNDLAKVVLKHADILLDTWTYLYEEAYIPLFKYLHEYLVAMLRSALKSSRYPTAKGCREIFDRPQNLQKICQHLTKLETTHEKILQAVAGVDTGSSYDINKSTSTVLLEFFHPLLDRVYFHFVDAGGVNDDGNDNGNHEPRLTATRIDRLPEWLLDYLNKNMLQVGGPYDIVVKLIGPHLAVSFCQELVRLVQWVIVDQRNFFENPAISGLQSNPQILYKAIEQFLEFDATLIELLARTNPNMTVGSTVQLETDSFSFMGLMDILVTFNDCLFDWWLQRERESVFSTLFPDDDDAPLASHTSSRGELFCALIRSVQLKASTLTNPSKYLREVAVPLCSKFVDSIHHTSVDLRNRLVQRRICKHDIISNIKSWIEIVNGTKLAAEVLLTKERAWHHEEKRSSKTATTLANSVSTQSDHDLARFGRSLERLVEVMMEEFAGAFVETTLMEHAKFASYLMLASHLLASPEWDAEDMMGEGDLTMELRETNLILQYFQQTCDSVIKRRNKMLFSERDNEQENSALFAPMGMRIRVVNQIVDKLLEVALDINRVTPDVWINGAAVFARDVYVLLGSDCEIPAVDRLLDVTKLMTMDYERISALFNALCDLIGSDCFIDIQEFTDDATLREEATSMLKAKYISCPLDYAVSILNRRRS